MNRLLEEAQKRKIVISIVLKNGKVVDGYVVNVTDDHCVVRTHKTPAETIYQFSTVRIDEIICTHHNLGENY